MTSKTPETQQQLAALAELCCQVLAGTNDLFVERSNALLKALVVNGFARTSDKPLQVELERLITQSCLECSMHRRVAVVRITEDLQARFNRLARWESSQPNVSGRE